MKPYSSDLRQRLVDAVERGEGSLRDLAALFGVSLSFLVRLLRRYRDTGSVAPKPHAGGPTPRLDDRAVQDLLGLVRAQPDATLAELQDRLGVRCSVMTIARALERQGITRKKKTRHAQQVLAPALGPGDVVVWDNLQPHKDAEAIRAVEQAGAVVVPAPPWSPDLIPIEEMFSKVKEALQSLAGRTTDAVYAALAAALEQVSPQDIRGWFQHRAAYAMHT